MLTGFLRAAKFLTLEHIFLDRDLPYQTQLVPLAAILAELGDSWEEIGTKQKVRQWYWSGVLGELYGGAVESRHARDLPECLSWIRDGGSLTDHGARRQLQSRTVFSRFARGTALRIRGFTLF